MPPVRIAISSSIAFRRSPKPGALTAADLQPAAQLVDNERRERLALDVLGNDQKRLPRLDDRLKNRQHRLKRRQLLLVDQDINVLELGNHLLRIGDEVGREIAAVELHALDDVELGLGGLRLLDRDHALVADLLHRIGDHLADRGVAVRRDRADLRDLLRALHLLGAGLDVLHDLGHGEVDAALEVHRVHARRDRLRPFAHDRCRQNRRGRRAVAGDIARLRGHFAHHLGAHVLEFVRELDLLRDRHAVLGHTRRAERLVEHDVAALRAERDFHRVRENFDAPEHPVARIG